jgi:hypothetical protein
MIESNVRKHPQQGPVTMQTGTSYSDPLPVHQDEALVNTDRVRKRVQHDRATLRKEKDRERTNREHLSYDHPAKIAGFDRIVKGNFISSSSNRYDDGHLIIQNDIQAKIQAESKVASQTDILEHWVKDDSIPDINLAITSTYCHIQEKWVATQYGLLFGRSGLHFAVYFFELLLRMPFDNFDDFKDTYMGMVCDFAEGERDGFKRGSGEEKQVEPEEQEFEQTAKEPHQREEAQSKEDNSESVEERGSTTGPPQKKTKTMPVPSYIARKLAQARNRPSTSTKNPADALIKKMSEQSKSGNKKASKKKKTPKRKSYPLGISITQASTRGKSSQCRYCLSFIDRGRWHSVRRRKNSTNNKWDHTWHYHLQCVQHFSPAERQQLLAIATQSEDISEETIAQLESTIEDCHVVTRHT